jgi:hypothetical protein
MSSKFRSSEIVGTLRFLDSTPPAVFRGIKIGSRKAIS